MLMRLPLHKTNTIKSYTPKPTVFLELLSHVFQLQPGFSHQYNTFENYGRYNRDDISGTQVVKVENIAADVCFCVKGS